MGCGTRCRIHMREPTLAVESLASPTRRRQMFSTSACVKRVRSSNANPQSNWARPIFRTGLGGGLNGLCGRKRGCMDSPYAPSSTRLFRLPLILAPFHCAKLEWGRRPTGRGGARRSGQLSRCGRSLSEDPDKRGRFSRELLRSSRAEQACATRTSGHGLDSFISRIYF
jgi:hypothetical protein